MSAEDDRVEVSIVVRADSERVWQLLCEPGRFITLASHTGPVLERMNPGLWKVRDEDFGTFLIRKVSAVERRHCVYRWEPVSDDGDPRTGSTLVEFWIEDGGYRCLIVRVRESGLGPAGHAGGRGRDTAEAIEGWTAALEAARRTLEQD
jgi:uncharacterized protein YndB with AHSA1/START domain